MVSMMRRTQTTQTTRQTRARRGAGFTLIETVIAIVILSVGILALAAMLADGLAYMSMSEYDYIAQQKAAEAIESIYTARNLGQATWSTICNVGSAVCGSGIFLTGAQTLCDPGPDGIVGTADDFSGSACSVQPDAILLPGAGGTYSSSPQKIPLTTYNFQRTITVAAVAGVANLRTITVLITYTAGRFQRSYQLVTTISNFS
jgi:prepilin-type N-terminal cleavage/methylation domain-containing protein